MFFCFARPLSRNVLFLCDTLKSNYSGQSLFYLSPQNNLNAKCKISSINSFNGAKWKYQEKSLKFPGTNLAEYVTWKQNRNLGENKASKNSDILYRRSKGLNYECLLSKDMYYLYIPT